MTELVRFSEKRHCFVDRRGKAIKGITTSKFTDGKKKSFKNRYVENIGKKSERELQAYWESGIMPGDPAARRAVTFMLDHGIEISQWQVVVRNYVRAGIDHGTAADFIAKDGTIIEYKWSGHSLDRFMTIWKTAGPDNPTGERTKYIAHFGKILPATYYNSYIGQLLGTMEMYAYTYNLAPDSLIKGALMVSCKDKVFWYPITLVYKPMTGCNAIREKPVAEKKPEARPKAKPKQKRKPRAKPCTNEKTTAKKQTKKKRD